MILSIPDRGIRDRLVSSLSKNNRHTDSKGNSNGKAHKTINKVPTENEEASLEENSSLLCSVHV